LKIMINKTKIFIILLLTLGLLQSCSSNNKNKSEHGHGAHDGHSHEEGETSNIANLTSEQLKTIGISYGKIEEKNLTATIKANGTLSVPNDHKANATSLYGGVVQTLKVQLGSYVRKGQVIATIANPEFLQVQEEYLSINSKMTFAHQEYQRQKELFEGNAGAAKNLQNATAEVKALQARKASLQQQIRLMGVNPAAINSKNLRSSLVVTSPISGAVSKVFAQIGSYVDVSTPVIEIVDNGAIHLDLQVFEKDLPLLNIGQTITFTLTNNPVKTYEAEIFSIGMAFENDSKTIPVHAKVKGNKSGLIDGMNISAVVNLSNAMTQAVPKDAIVESEGKFYIFIKSKEVKTEHQHENEPHTHKQGDNHSHEESKTAFEKIEVLKGVSDLGYTGITLIKDIPKDAQVVTKGAFFINSVLTNSGEHSH
ncbi:MAG TPA: efflux RND transporter periplasmic adaptor subunit, partial [Edaphocola sp.]|nr:efflux RND transporter periplasmic adaptor subunit [Edaphocola sp.]